MTHSNSISLTPELQERLLLLLNSARSPRDISALLPKGNRRQVLDPTLGIRLLKARQNQPGKRFESLDTLREAEGFGVEEMELLSEAVQQSSAEALRQRLYNNQVLYDNFDLRYLAIDLGPDPIEHLNTLELERALRNIISRSIPQLADSDALSADLRTAAIQVRRNYFEPFDSAHLASYGMALWFYHFDEDNWFSFENIRKEIEWMFNTYFQFQNTPPLFLIKGFEQKLLGTDGITVIDLPVTLNIREQKLYVWRGQLFD